MISGLLRELMTERGLTQKGLAETMEVPLQRVKNLCGGWAKKLTREEGEALINKLNVSGNWLATGQPPMFRSETEQRAASVMAQLGSAAEAARSLGLNAEQGRVVMELLFFAQTGNPEAARQALAELAGLKPDEAALLDNYRNSPKEARDALKATSAALAQSGLAKGKAA